MANLTAPERAALATVIGYSALHLDEGMSQDPRGTDLMLAVSLLMELMGQDFATFEALVAIGKELLAGPCQDECCRGEG